MKFPEIEFRAALQTRLETTGYRTYYADGPEEAAGVYLVHRDTEYAEHGTKGQVGWDLSVYIDAWDASPGACTVDEVAQAMNEVMEKLTCSHDPLGSQNFLSITGWRVIRQDVGFVRMEAEAGAWPHAVLQMVFWITEN